MQVINTNVSSLNSQRHLNNTQAALSTTLERLSSGKRINNAKDDAAGLGISERMTAQINGMNQAIRNARDGISMSQTAEGALSTSNEMLQRIRTLAVQSSNATNNSIDRQALQDEVNELTAELDRIAQTTTFNGRALLNGTLGGQNYQVGANAGELITASGSNFRTAIYGANRVYSQALAQATVTQVQQWKKNGTDLALDTDTGKVDAAPGLTDSITIASRMGSATVTFGTVGAKKAAEQINAETGKTGVTATARTEALLTATANTAYSFEIKSNNSSNVTVSFNVGADLNADGYAEAINAFNAASAKTGVTAEYEANLGGGGIKLTNASGETISLFQMSGGIAKLGNIKYDSKTDQASVQGPTAFTNVDAVAAAQAALATSEKAHAAATDKSTTIDDLVSKKNALATALKAASLSVVGTLTFDSESSFNITGVSADFAPDKTGGAAASSKLKSVSTLDVTDFRKAQLAISICDAAINTVTKEMSRYGALQSRFDSTVKNLQVTSENTSNARSRIKDADYAAETAELSRATILQQAGTSMLAQANQRPQTVLSLLG